MMYSTTCSYAIRALCRLTIINPEGYVRIQEVCEGSELPSYFIAKIFRDLVRAGLLVSAKGRGGGYALAKPARMIRLYDIVDAVDGVSDYQRCVVGLAECNDKQPCPQHEHFKSLRQRMLSYLNTTTLQDMSEALNKKLDILGMTLPTIEGESVSDRPKR
ncbi:MAG: RrF2 family transcriptional regulator [Phycisphaerales bacterium JB063]